MNPCDQVDFSLVIFADYGMASRKPEEEDTVREEPKGERERRSFQAADGAGRVQSVHNEKMWNDGSRSR